jgi:hypothetical protein
MASMLYDQPLPRHPIIIFQVLGNLFGQLIAFELGYQVERAIDTFSTTRVEGRAFRNSSMAAK